MPAAKGIDLARAEAGPPRWVSTVAEEWSAFADAHGLELDADALRLTGVYRGVEIACQARAGAVAGDRSTWLRVPIEAPSDPGFAIGQASSEHVVFKLVMRITGSSMQTGEPAFDAKFVRSGTPPRKLLSPKARSLLLQLDTLVSRSGGVVRANARGVHVRIPGVVRSEVLIEHLDRMVELGRRAEPESAQAGPYRS